MRRTHHPNRQNSQALKRLPRQCPHSVISDPSLLGRLRATQKNTSNSWLRGNTAPRLSSALNMATSPRVLLAAASSAPIPLRVPRSSLNCITRHRYTCSFSSPAPAPFPFALPYDKTPCSCNDPAVPAFTSPLTPYNLWDTRIFRGFLPSAARIKLLSN